MPSRPLSRDNNRLCVVINRLRALVAAALDANRRVGLDPLTQEEINTLIVLTLRKIDAQKLHKLYGELGN
jgi:hypothetical protein